MLMDDKWWQDVWSSPEGKLAIRMNDEKPITVGEWEKFRQTLLTPVPDVFIKAFTEGKE